MPTSGERPWHDAVRASGCSHLAHRGRTRYWRRESRSGQARTRNRTDHQGGGGRVRSCREPESLRSSRSQSPSGRHLRPRSGPIPSAEVCSAEQAGHRSGWGRELWLVNSRAQVGSVVVVAPSDYFAEAEIAGLESPGGRKCLARALGRALTFERHHQLEWSHTVRVAFVPVAKPLGGAIAVHVLAKLPPLEGVKLKARYINVDAAFFRAGPADIAFFALGATRFPPTTEDHLLALLHSRAEAQKL